MENNFDEKLLTGTEEEKLLSPNPEENYPLQNAKEFLTRTPAHELRNVFSGTPDFPPIPKKETAKPETPEPPVTPTEKPRHLLAKFIWIFLLMILLAVTGLYIWGGMLLGNY